MNPTDDEIPGRGPDRRLLILPVTVRELAEVVGKKPFRVIYELMEIDVFVNQEHELSEEVLRAWAEKFDYRFRFTYRMDSGDA